MRSALTAKSPHRRTELRRDARADREHNPRSRSISCSSPRRLRARSRTRTERSPSILTAPTRSSRCADGTVDLGAIATEFFLLGIDPYPRKEGAEFEAPKVAGRSRQASICRAGGAQKSRRRGQDVIPKRDSCIEAAETLLSRPLGLRASLYSFLKQGVVRPISCRKRFASRSTPWAEIRARRW